jgi:hypothetical protein
MKQVVLVDLEVGAHRSLDTDSDTIYIRKLDEEADGGGQITSEIVAVQVQRPGRRTTTRRIMMQGMTTRTMHIVLWCLGGVPYTSTV